MLELDETPVDRRRLAHPVGLLALVVLLLQFIAAQVVDDAGAVRVAEHVDRRPDAVAETPRNEQVIARRDDMPSPIAADLRPCADGSAVRTALVADCG